jgi:DNA-binding NarL/FixJ family response regulator
MLEGLKSLLATLFDSVVMVSDRPSLFAAASKLRPRLIIADLHLPGEGDGPLVREVRMRFPRVKLIALSFPEEGPFAAKALEEGAQGVVLKRSAVDDLIPAVRHAMRGRIFVSPAFLLPGEGALPTGGE